MNEQEKHLLRITFANPNLKYRHPFMLILKDYLDNEEILYDIYNNPQDYTNTEAVIQLMETLESGVAKERIRALMALAWQEQEENYQKFKEKK